MTKVEEQRDEDTGDATLGRNEPWEWYYKCNMRSRNNGKRRYNSWVSLILFRTMTNAGQIMRF